MRIIYAKSYSHKTDKHPPALPEDLEYRILDMLECVKDVAVARMVCKRWKRILDRNFYLWRRLKGLTLPRRFPSEAEKWYRKAAACGNREALALLALLYYYGHHSENNAFFPLVSSAVD
eukprot:jgi/Galph1/3790/GphlegSOOS_G2497.1